MSASLVHHHASFDRAVISFAKRPIATRNVRSATGIVRSRSAGKRILATMGLRSSSLRRLRICRASLDARARRARRFKASFLINPFVAFTPVLAPKGRGLRTGRPSPDIVHVASPISLPSRSSVVPRKAFAGGHTHGSRRRSRDECRSAVPIFNDGLAALSTQKNLIGWKCFCSRGMPKVRKWV